MGLAGRGAGRSSSGASSHHLPSLLSSALASCPECEGSSHTPCSTDLPFSMQHTSVIIMVTAVSLSVTEGDPEGSDLGSMGSRARGQVLTSPLAGHSIGLIAHPTRPNVHLGLPSSPGTKHCLRSTLMAGQCVAPQALGAAAVSAGAPSRGSTGENELLS